MKPPYESIISGLLREYKQKHERCPANCNQINGPITDVNGQSCEERNYTQCLMFQDLLRNQTRKNAGR